MKKFFGLFMLVLFFDISITLAQEPDFVEKSDEKSNRKADKKLKASYYDEVKVSEVLNKTDEKFAFSNKKLIKEGDKAFENGDFYKAINFYQTVVSAASKNKIRRKSNFKLANTFFEVKDYNKARSHYNTTINLDFKHKFILANYNYANSLKRLEKYEAAINAYQLFLTLSEKNTKVDVEKNRAILAIKGCKFALETKQFNEDFTIQNAGNNVNGKFDDFGPSIRGSQLVFSKIIDEWRENDLKSTNLSQIYSSEIYNDKYNFAQLFSSSVNDEKMSVSNPSFSVNGEEVYFTKCAVKNNRKTNCAIYYSYLDNGIWTKATRLGDNVNEEGAETDYPQIVLDENGNEILYFSAEREKGRGGKDIYFAEKNDNGSFSRARNLGYPINTRYDDISPFYHTTSRTLYFSTNGKFSFGGFDIFKSVKSDDEFQEPIHMNYPFNTSLDDYDLIFNEKATLGYLVSNRKGVYTEKGETCCSDIFEVKTTKVDIYVKGLIYLEKDGERKIIDDAVIELSDNNGDGEVIKSSDGTFMFKVAKDKKYKILANSEGFDEGEILFNTFHITKSDTLQYDLFLDNIITEDPFHLSTPKEEVKHNAFNQEIIGVIYYGFNTSKLTNEAPATLKHVIKYLKDNPRVIVEISAHTDDVGPADFNLSLSEDRCNAAAKYLEYYGVKPERIVKKWYGETQPIAPNKYDDGSDYEEGRERNRRTEFKAIGVL